MFRVGGANLNFIPAHGYVLTLHVGSDERYGPARFFVLERTPKGLEAELWFGSGPEGVIRLRPDHLKRYLTRTGLDLSGLEPLFKDRFAGP